MTTFHDQQPQSRRAVRQSERGDGERGEAAEQTGFTDAQSSSFTEAQAAAPQQFSAPAADMWDTVSRRAAQLPPVSIQEAATPGRRAALPPVPTPEPLLYSTQSRPTAPNYDGPTFRSRGTGAPQPVPFDTTAVEPTESTLQSGAGYRVRDFSPAIPAEGSRSSEPTPAASTVPPTDLEYHTEARFLSAAAAAPLAPISEIPAAVAPINNKLWAAPEPTPAPAAFTPVSSDFPLEQTYTRRELRALQQAEDAAALSSQAPAAPQAPAAFQTPAPVQAPAAFQSPAAPIEPAPIESAPEMLSTQQPGVFPLIEPSASAPRATPPASSAPPVTPAAPIASPTFVPSAPAAPVSSSPFESLFNPPAAAVQQPEPVAQVPADIAPTPFVEEASPWTPPTGHWSTQLGAVDDDIETTVNRRVGSGSTATSALVLPSIPLGNDIRGPLTSTGEIMLTGSIDLPRTLASSGQSDRFDNGGIDDLFDLSDAEIISTDSSPVRAIRAVSTHTSGHGVTHTQKPKGTRALTALLIAASSMAVVVAGLLVAAFAFNVF